MKYIKRLLCVCLIACICFCAVGCNKVNDNNSSGLSSTITQTETSSIDSEIESRETITQTETSSNDSKIESTTENTSTKESTVSTADKTNIVESNTNTNGTKPNSSSNNSNSSEMTTSTKMYSVPNFVGKFIYDIEDPGSMYFEEFEHFTIITQSQNNYEYPNGYILAQSIKAGTDVEEKTEITLFLSSREEKKVPNVLGLDKEKAIEELEKCGFAVELREKMDFDCMPNTVLDTEPEYSTSVVVGATITLYINSLSE